jgi:folate-binding protein YgfZ
VCQNADSISSCGNLGYDPAAETRVSQYCSLDDYRLIAVGGPDRTTFLQGQLTQDIRRVMDAECRLAGWADAKGRLAWAGQVFALDDRYWMLVPAAMAAALTSRLRMFVLRARADVVCDDLAVLGRIETAVPAMGTPALPPGWSARRLAGDATRSLLVGPAASRAAITGPSAPQDLQRSWLVHDIRAGIPEISPATSGEFVPQMVNLDLLDGISYTKGCYTGQEIVARTRYLGRVKRRMLRFSCAGNTEPGSPVFGERGIVGQVVRAVAVDPGTELLAVIRIEDLTGPLFMDEERSRMLTRLPLPYPIPEEQP